MNVQPWPSAPPPAAGRFLATPAAPARAVFVHHGTVPLTVVGRETGRRYHFAQPGARVVVDARDAPQLSRLPTLKRAT
jgi:hypothetical protein